MPHDPKPVKKVMAYSLKIMELLLYTIFIVKEREDGLQRQEHAGSSAFGSLHHRAPRSILHRAMDRRIRLPETHQVSRRNETFRFTLQTGKNVYTFVEFFYFLFFNRLDSRSKSTHSGKT